jgi:hypothetical protein
LYTSVIEKNLRRAEGGGAGDIEVINAGIPGFTTYQELEFLKLYGISMEPDLLVLGFVFNDVYYKYLHRPVADKMLGLDPSVKLNRFDKRGWLGFLFKDSYLAHEIAYSIERVQKKIAGHPFLGFERRDDFYLAWKEHGWDDTRNLIGEMRDFLAESGTEMIIVIFPVSEQFVPAVKALDEDLVFYPQNRMLEICDALAIACVDLADQISDHGGASLFDDYLHLNGAGNDIIAEEMTNYLTNNRSLWLE